MININKLKTLYLGRQGENDANIAVFDISPWIEEYGAGTAKLLYQRSGDELPYIANITQSGETVSWIFTSDDTAYSGYGKAQLNYYVDDVLAKTVIFTTKCEKSLTDETETPKEVKNALDMIAGELDGKLEPSNIKAGQNVTVDIDGNDVTINSTGGGTVDAYTKAETDALLDEKQDKDFVVTFTNGTPVTADKTLAQIYGAYTDGKNVYGIMGNDLYQLQFIRSDNATFYSLNGFVNKVLVVQSSGINYVEFISQSQLTAGAGISIANNVISATTGFNVLVVSSLPATGDRQTIYLLSNGGTSPDYYDEYIYVPNNDSWEKIGSTDIDLSDYYTKAETNTLLADKADTSALASYATITALNNGLATKADASTTYTKTEVDTALSGKVSSSSVSTIWTGTQAEYDAITTKDSNTLYFIVEASNGV